ncbi:Zn-dependent amino-or carboxypeptidase, M28 family [Bryocella elongata]|uniref:Zn-dependent amino-or carboxypeptidase, M28 family n=1 Tax=Bryocella elongata TaxID=863522 RepID=A0A1H5Y9S8_9BACT|nr:M28 family peptidase [Bryocella elongata]SEG20525.1 Zn-dependent amino-or carboxypeptidase, M28 family [Bryocella elongata]
MKPRSIVTAALAAAVLAPVATRMTAQAQSIEAAEKLVSADRIRDLDKYISDDKFEGRYPGSAGGNAAAAFIAAEFAKAGLKPMGDNGTFLQQVNFVSMKVKPAETIAVLKPAHGEAAPLQFGDDYTISDEQLHAHETVDAPIVFVGYGATAPEYQWDDYAGVDVKGKVILCIVGDPPSNDPKFFMGDALTYYGRWTYKFEHAAKMGAIGALIIHRTDLASYGWNVVQNSNTGEKTYLRDDANPRLKAASWVQLEVARKIFAMSGLDLDKEFDAAGKRGFKAVELPVHFQATVSSTVKPFQSPNVVGGLPGNGAPDQAVLYTAHYDHLGVDPSVPGPDKIFNGAADNGTGVAMLIEMAHAWGDATKHGLKLPHSVLFSAVTAEEQGLLGSEYLGQHTPIPSAQIALDINVDMLLPLGVQQEVNVNGAQRTTFYPQVEATAKRFGLAIVPDPRPSAGSYYRSDHFSLSRLGIPAFSIDSGTLYEGHDHAWGIAKEKAFNEHDYHNVTDNFDPTWDFRGDANIARFGMDLGWQVIHLPHTIEWLHGDEFEAARLKSEGR